ncbi:hemerythrin domain-containing protein [Kocuria sediminis]|uniref:Hemerythrin domain-containing protein n=1 Tax=Kocuria sediminis TaxID=1038857 RepID=A0A6N8GR32_9MICC|nr:hemerythrin domain-containing protein [Kocuria sediminis]MUN64632.1 hemerythrin domain-containing protein [Kocuria sediminis]
MTRSIADQTVAELGGRLSVLTRQQKDHIELDRLLRELDGADAAGQGQVLLRIYRLVFPHAFAEESVLWPVMRRILPDGHELTLQVEQEHQEVNELVTALERLDAEDPQRQTVLARLVEVLREDVRDEEDELLPRLQQLLGPGQLRGLGLAWEVLRRTAPTRAHPVVARRPPGNVIAALPLSVLDRLRDLVDAAVLRGPGRGAPVLRSVSSGLGAVAHRIERVPVMRRGEDPSTGRADV